MSSTSHTSLDAAAVDRKARLAKLASLKRKQPSSDTPVSDAPESSRTDEEDSNINNDTPSLPTDIYLSGRNFDVSTRGPRLGFEHSPADAAKSATVEARASAISTLAEQQAAKDETEAEKGIDLFKLQPRKPNWDLKRDLAEKMKVVDVRTQNAIARLVRERIENSKREALERKRREGAAKSGRDQEDGGEEVGIDGNTLVEGVHLREQEEQEETKREKDLEAEEGAIP